jgi:hexokinase
MNPDRKAAETFLVKNRMHPDAIDLSKTVEHMLVEMARGLNGEASSLAMIPTYVEVDAQIPLDRKAVVLDAGGTNLRAALMSFSSEGKPIIENFSKHPMPGTGGRDVGKEEFFDTLAALVEPLIDQAEKIGFCFSYPTEIFPDNDGRLIHWSKEIKAPEVEGRMIGSDLRAALSKRGVAAPPEVIILNDTVATLLTGKVSQSDRIWGGYVGFILGTGTNTCYVESNSRIGKAAGLDSAHAQIINCESGSYACTQRGKADERLGAATARPETYWLEKMLSGAYFGSLATHTVSLAAEYGLFKAGTAALLTGLGEISTKDADNYTHNPAGGANALVDVMKKAGDASDAARLWYLMDALLERAAKLTAANLAASVLKGRTGSGPLEPVCLTIDGTTYYRYYRFQHRVESYLRPFLTQRDKFYETVQVDDAPLIGAAVAALTN